MYTGRHWLYIYIYRNILYEHVMKNISCTFPAKKWFPAKILGHPSNLNSWFWLQLVALIKIDDIYHRHFWFIYIYIYRCNPLKFETRCCKRAFINRMARSIMLFIVSWKWSRKHYSLRMDFLVFNSRPFFETKYSMKLHSTQKKWWD